MEVSAIAEGSPAVPVATPESGYGESAAPTFNDPPQSTPAIESNPYTGETAASLAELNAEYAAYGAFTIAGMAGNDYDAAMSLEWTDVETPGKPVPVDIDVSELMNYETIEAYILNLGRYDGVQVSVLGQSERGRNIYMVTVDLPGGSVADKPLLMLTGGVHAREFAGTDYIVKCLNDTLACAQTDAVVRALLQSVTIVTVPLVNPDGRELIIEGGDPSRKSNANGVDLNRAMPAVNAGQLAAGTALTEDFSTVPGMDFFAGYRLGAESEAQAMIRWMNAYVPQATAYIDLHQQGGVTFYNKEFASSASDEACHEFGEEISGLLNDGYEPWKEHEGHALDGDGGTMTDYARSVAEGFTYSYRLGRMAFLMDGEEVPLLWFGSIDNCMEFYRPVNSRFLMHINRDWQEALLSRPGRKCARAQEKGIQ